MKSNSKNLKERRKIWKSLGICCQCGTKQIDNTSYCIECLEKHRKRTQSYRNTPNGKFATLKSSAKSRSIKFNLSDNEFCDWYSKIEKSCCYCGINETTLKSIGRNKSFLTVDRKNNDLGYSIDNICLACHRCNNLKSNFFTESQWMEIARKYIVCNLDKYHCI